MKKIQLTLCLVLGLAFGVSAFAGEVYVSTEHFDQYAYTEDNRLDCQDYRNGNGEYRRSGGDNRCSYENQDRYRCTRCEKSGTFFGSRVSYEVYEIIQTRRDDRRTDRDDRTRPGRDNSGRNDRVEPTPQPTEFWVELSSLPFADGQGQVNGTSDWVADSRTGRKLGHNWPMCAAQAPMEAACKAAGYNKYVGFQKSTRSSGSCASKNNSSDSGWRRWSQAEHTTRVKCAY